MCGGDLNIEADVNVIECEYCGTMQTVSTADNEKKVNLFNRANRLRLNSEFDNAQAFMKALLRNSPRKQKLIESLQLRYRIYR